MTAATTDTPPERDGSDPSDALVLPIWAWYPQPGSWVEVGEGTAEDVDGRYRTAHRHRVCGGAWLRLPRGKTPHGTPAEMGAPVALDTGEPGPPDALPPAWAELIEALPILAKARTSDVSPFYCTHDELHVLTDASKVTDAERARLEEIGFHVDEESGAFYSFRYGS